MKRCMILACLLSLLGFTSCAERGGVPQYGIYAAQIDGQNVRLLVGDDSREMTHARVSPDGQWLTFTRYNNKNWRGRAEEESGYMETEILLARSDGTGLQVAVPPVKDALNANSSWLPDGSGIIYVSTDNPERKPTLMQFTLADKKKTRLPTPPHLLVSDPHIVNDRLVFPSIDPVGKVDVLWTMRIDGADARQLTRPFVPPDAKTDKFHLGDYDPRLSPQGDRVAFMRMMPDGHWHSVVQDLRSGVELDLTSGRSGHDATPEWSSRGDALVLWHIDTKDHKEMGVYRVNPDGTDRRMVPLPRGFLHSHPGFFPNGNGKMPERIIYSAKRFDGLP